MAKWQRPRAELIAQLANQRKALGASAENYDRGEKWEAQRLATTVYTLVHDGGRNSQSILTQIGIRGSLRFISSGRPVDHRNLADEHPLVMMQIGGENSGYVPRLGESSNENRNVQFDRWWTSDLIYRSREKTLSRRELVFALRDKEGGSHFDPQLNDDGYLAMTRDATRGWYVTTDNGPSARLLGLELASMRQVAWELIESLNTIPDNFH